MTAARPPAITAGVRWKVEGRGKRWQAGPWMPRSICGMVKVRQQSSRGATEADGAFGDD